jgi:hypothetical protein
MNKTIEVNGYIYEIGKLYLDSEGMKCRLVGLSVNQLYPFKIHSEGRDWVADKISVIENAGTIIKAAYKPEVGKLYELSDNEDFSHSFVFLLGHINDDDNYPYKAEDDCAYRFIRPVPEDKREFGE